MEVRNAKIAEAAVAVVSRYGLRKTTMGDMAQAAGVSRQTIYNVYDNKEDVVRDAIRFVVVQGITDMTDGWTQVDDLGAKIDIFFAQGPIAFFDWIKSSPDAADLLNQLHETEASTFDEGSANWIAAVSRLFDPYAAQLHAVDQTPNDVGRFLYLTAHSAKTSSVSREDLLSRLATLRASVLALVK